MLLVVGFVPITVMTGFAGGMPPHFENIPVFAAWTRRFGAVEHQASQGGLVAVDDNLPLGAADNPAKARRLTAMDEV
jgi:hypothetical protein